jgi:hypothetical protein
VGSFTYETALLDVEQGAVGRHEEAQVLQGVQESDREGDDLHLFERKDDQQVRRGIVYVPANVEFGLPAKRLEIPRDHRRPSARAGATGFGGIKR